MCGPEAPRARRDLSPRSGLGSGSLSWWGLTMPLPPILRSLVRSSPTVAPIPNRAVISVSGSQAAEFLNGLTAASVPGHPQSHFYSAFLHAQVRSPFIINQTVTDLSPCREGSFTIYLFGRKPLPRVALNTLLNTMDSRLKHLQFFPCSSAMSFDPR